MEWIDKKQNKSIVCFFEELLFLSCVLLWDSSPPSTFVNISALSGNAVDDISKILLLLVSKIIGTIM